MGKGSGSLPPPQVMQPSLNVPNEQNLQAAAIWRTMAAMPWTSSPWRSVDFGFGLPSAPLHVPQYQPQQGQAMFNPGYGGGYMQPQQAQPGMAPPMSMMPPQNPLWPMMPFGGMGMFPPPLTYAGPGNYFPGTQRPGEPQPQQGQPQQGGDKSPTVTAPGAPDKPVRQHEGRTT